MQLCKTLYSLLQDSCDEQELFKAMSQVASTLLIIGEQNVQPEVPSSSRSEDSAHLADSTHPGDSSHSTDPSHSTDSVHSSNLETSASQTSGFSSQSTNETKPSPSHTQRTLEPSNSSSASDAVFKMTNSNRVHTMEQDSDTVHSSSTGFSSAHSMEQDSSTAYSTVTEQDSASLRTAESAASAAVKGSFEQVLANAEELEEKWSLTFEQFVGALQGEPVLCQFFAEQNTIDLSGTNVDPVLNPYTRTIMATSP